MSARAWDTRPNLPKHELAAAIAARHTLLPTDLVWKPRAVRNGPGRGAFVGTLLGVPVDGRSIGRGVAYQFVMLNGEVRTVWWDGTILSDIGVQYPCLYDIDTDEAVSRNPKAMVWFSRLEDVQSDLNTEGETK